MLSSSIPDARIEPRTGGVGRSIFTIRTARQNDDSLTRIRLLMARSVQSFTGRQDKLLISPSPASAFGWHQLNRWLTTGNPAGIVGSLSCLRSLIREPLANSFGCTFELTC